MAIAGRVLLECLASFLAQAAPIQEPQQPPPPPWTVVATPEPGVHAVGELQLAVSSDGTYVGSYRSDGDAGPAQATHVVRSRDRGATWEPVAQLDSLREGNLIEHEDVLWLLGAEGEFPLALRSRDAGETWERGASSLRGADFVEIASDAVIHAGRVWRCYARTLVQACEGMREHVFVASAALGTDLSEPTNWRWSSELPVDCLKSSYLGRRHLLAEPGRARGVHLFASNENPARAFRAVASVASDGWALSEDHDLPDWILPIGAWLSPLVWSSADGRSYVLVGESTTAAPPPEHPTSRHALALHSAELVGDWGRTLPEPKWVTTTLLRDTREHPIEFWRSAAVIEGDDLAVLFAFGEPWLPVKLQPAAHPKIAFLRVPKFRERSRKDPPLWESKR